MRKRLLCTSLVVLCLWAGPVVAAPATGDDPIYDRWNACMAKTQNQTTLGMVTCAEDASTAYETLMRVLYESLEKHNDWVDTRLLAASQRHWIAFREAEKHTQRDSAERRGGTLAGVEIAQADMEARRERVNELKTYFPPVSVDDPDSWNTAAKAAR